MLLIIYFFIVLFYLLVITWINFGFNKVEDFKLRDLKPKTKFSIVIPFRNEAKNLPKLLKSIENLNYPKTHFEVILVDDESMDNWKMVLDTFREKSQNTRTDNIQIISNNRISKSPKKDAISSAINVTKNNWIITTDADCVLPKYWLDAFDEFIQLKKPTAIAAPVRFTGASSFFNRFQIIDALSLQAVTIGTFGVGKPFMCNGANFAYKKSAFFAVNRFEGNDEYASGDDVFLLQKFIKSDKTKVEFLKTNKAIVTTTVAPNFSEFIQQRVRWASKTVGYTSVFSKLLGVLVLVTNFLMVWLIPFCLFGLLSFKSAVLLFLIKFSIDLLLIFKTARLFTQGPVMLSYPFVSLLHPFVTVFLALKAPFSSYYWKGRKF